MCSSLTKLSLQTDGKCSENYFLKRRCEGQTSAVRGTHVRDQQRLTRWEEALPISLHGLQLYQLGVLQRPLPEGEGLLGKTRAAEDPLGPSIFQPLLRGGPSHMFPPQSRGKVNKRLLSGTRSSEGRPVVLGTQRDTDDVLVLPG